MARVWWLLVMPLLAGLGVVQVISWLPDTWAPWSVFVLCLVALVWTVREIRWSRRMQRQTAAELERMMED